MIKFTICTKPNRFCFPIKDKGLKYRASCLQYTDIFVQFSDLLIYRIQSYIDGQPDMRLYDLYCDNGRTGTNFDRPEFERMMEDVRSGKVDCIVVKDLSRFGRNYRETGNYLERIFPLLDVRFIAVNDNFDTLTAERTQDGYIVPLKNIMNAVYSKDISRKILPAISTKQQKGEFIGSWAAYGYSHHS